MKANIFIHALPPHKIIPKMLMITPPGKGKLNITRQAIFDLKFDLKPESPPPAERRKELDEIMYQCNYSISIYIFLEDLV